MRTTILLVLLPLAAGSGVALAQQSGSSSVGGTPVQAPGTAGATKDTGATGGTRTKGDTAAAADQPAAEAGATASGPIELRTIIGDKPIEITADEATEPFEAFRQTGHNPFAGDEAAIAAGKKVYAKICQACHMPDGSGRIGPSLTDDQWRHPRLATEAGRFEIIHSGGAGAMQAFHRRIGIDEILQVMAYIDTFRAGAASN